ncbi:MAG: immunity 26/phosphotriesterase HocA family protein [Byssovorax sp.]
MKPKPQFIREGDWFAVPLETGGYAIGVVARKSKGGVLLGYFFGPRREKVPTIEDTKDLSVHGAVLVGRFGDLSLRDRTWPLLGPRPGWVREEWPMPRFGRVEPYANRGWIVIYGDDPSDVIREERCSMEDASKLLPDRLAGAGAVEFRLTKLLAKT